MIIHLASYPGSCDSWVQVLISRHFRHLVSSVYPTTLPFESYQIQSWTQLHSRSRAADDLLLAYQNRGADRDARPWLRLIAAPCRDTLTEAMRAALAEDPDVYFVRTHERPFPRYFAGEKVLLVSRHPGAALWDYLSLLNAEPAGNGRHEERIVEEVIFGEVLFGSWSDFIQSWLHAVEELQQNAVVIDHTDLQRNETGVVDRIEALVADRGFTREESPTEAAAPAEVAPWESQFHHHEARLLEFMHGPVMRQLGYPEPDYTKCLDLAPAGQAHAFIESARNRAARAAAMRRARAEQLDELQRFAQNAAHKAAVRHSELVRHIELLRRETDRRTTLEAVDREKDSELAALRATVARCEMERRLWHAHRPVSGPARPLSPPSA